MRVLIVLSIVGQVVRFFSVAFLAPAALAFYDGNSAAAWHFGIAFAISLTTGLLLALGARNVSVIRRSESFAVVSGTWLIVGLLGSVPYIFSGLSVVDAIFESISGFTTTGATVLTDFTRYTRAFFLWRAMTQWFGGMGVIALFVVILPRLGVAGRQLFFAEASDAASEPVSPQIRETARRLWVLYIALTALETASLMLCGLDLYDAAVHSFTTLAAGGFSPNPQSAGGYQNAACEWVFIVFMLLAGTSFTLQWRAFSGKPVAFFQDGEFRFYLGCVIAGAALVAAILAKGLPGLDEIRTALFQCASLISSTGYASTDYNQWSDAARVVLIAVMLVGGCAGSAAGGAKAIRLLLVLKLLWSEIIRVLHPRAVIPVRYGRRIIPAEILRAVLILVVLYLFGYVLVGMTLVLLGADFVSGFSAALACLGNIGPGFDSVGPMESFAHLPAASKIVLTAAMWIGRLEIVAVLALFHPDVWKNFQLHGNRERLT